MSLRTIVFILLVANLGCESDPGSLKLCDGTGCTNINSIPPTKGGDLITPGGIPTTTGGTVFLKGVSSLNMPAKSTLLGASSNADGMTTLLLYEDLGSNIYRLRTRNLSSTGVLSEPKCDVLVTSSFSKYSARVTSESYYLVESLDYGSVIHRYSLADCSLEESQTFPYYVSSSSYNPFILTSLKWYVVNNGVLNIFDVSTKTKDGSISNLSKGDASLSWTYSNSYSDDGISLWFQVSDYIWRMKLDTYEFDWFAIPTSTYSCLRDVKISWREGDFLHLVCNLSTDGSPQYFTFNISKF